MFAVLLLTGVIMVAELFIMLLLTGVLPLAELFISDSCDK
jgi:hypothetical protein